MGNYASLFSYIVIVTRDFVTHCCMIYFITVVNRREDNIKNELEKDDSPHDLKELKTVLNSCRPLMSFSGYLEVQKPDHICLLDYIKAYETIKEHHLDLKDLEEEKLRAEATLQELDGPACAKKSVLDNMIASIEKLNQNETEAKSSYNLARQMLSEMYETNYESFNKCFAEYESII